VTHKQTGPTPDVCQDWILKDYIAKDGFLIFEASRELNTRDTKDLKFRDDTLTTPTFVIAAWGNTNTMQYHGPNSNVKGTVHFYAQEEKDHTKDYERSTMIQANDFSIPPVSTHYETFCFSRQDLFPHSTETEYLLGFEGVVDPRTSWMIHHMVVYYKTYNDCDTQIEVWRELLAVWAPGYKSVWYPQGVGLSITSQFSFMLEIHYDNKYQLKNRLDSSGFRLYTTTEKNVVQHEVGVFQIGDPLVRNMGMPVGPGLTKHTFACPSDCTETLFETPVTVFGEFFHMHQTGIMAQNKRINSDGIIKQNTVVEYFDFSQRGFHEVQQEPFVLKPGDAFETSCFYNSTTNSAIFGAGSTDEMCATYFFYYPKIPNRLALCGPRDNLFHACRALYDPTILESESKLERRFDETQDQCGSEVPSAVPTATVPVFSPTSIPTTFPTKRPSVPPTPAPTNEPSSIPSRMPTSLPSNEPSMVPSSMPSDVPTDVPSSFPSDAPSDMPSNVPSTAPTSLPSDAPSSMPTIASSNVPSYLPSSVPSNIPSTYPTTQGPSEIPSAAPTFREDNLQRIRSRFSSVPPSPVPVDRAASSFQQQDSMSIVTVALWLASTMILLLGITFFVLAMVMVKRPSGTFLVSE